jgi:hypothetical protein
MAHHHHLMSVPNKAFHSKNQRTRARDSFIPFALPLSFPKTYLSIAPKSKRANTNRDSNKLGQPYQTTAAPAAPYTYLNPTKFQKETIRPNQVPISRSEIIENLSVSKHVHSNNNPTHKLKQRGIAVTAYQNAGNQSKPTRNASPMLRNKATKQGENPFRYRTHSPASPNTLTTKRTSMRKQTVLQQNNLLKSISRCCTSQNQSSVKFTIYSCDSTVHWSIVQPS